MFLDRFAFNVERSTFRSARFSSREKIQLKLGD
jgi:hypothetical protein